MTRVPDQPEQPDPDAVATAPGERRFERFDCTDEEQRATGLKVALASLAREELVVMPTDTVYGVAVDAFAPSGVADLLAAKGRGRGMPVPVLVGSLPTLRAVVSTLSDAGEALVAAFWPGPLTIVCAEQSSLRWDLGETRGTVAVRMPDHPLALELLSRHGPLAVSSANITGRPPATTCDEAVDQLGNAVAVYLDAGPAGEPVASTIVDLTGARPRVLRQGAISTARLLDAVPDLEAPPAATTPADEPATDRPRP